MPREEQRAAAFLADAELFRGPPDDDVAAVYDGVADRYDRFRELWLRLAGAGAEQAMLEDLRAVLWPGARVLDAGCGTGFLARKMRELQPEIELTLIDLSPRCSAARATYRESASKEVCWSCPSPTTPSTWPRPGSSNGDRPCGR